MGLYFVGYDARLDARAELEGLLSGWGAVALYDGAWLVDHRFSALDLRNGLQGLLHDDDPAIVLELKPGSWWASEHASRSGLQWLRAHVLS